MNGEDKLRIMRKLMKEKQYDAYIIPHGDQHDNEYIAECDERIKFISNFSGSNGLGLVTKDVALMWTDGRYYIQIEKELYPGWQMKKIEGGEETLAQYIVAHLPQNSIIGMDFSLFTNNRASDIMNKCQNYKFVDDTNNIIDDIWGTLKPSYSSNKVIILADQFTGKSVSEKYQMLNERLQKEIKKNESFANINKFRMLISRLDDIAWLLNLRGNDIPYNPVFFSYGLFYTTPEGLYTNLFVDKKKFDNPEIKKHCDENKIYLFEYKDVFEELKKFPDDMVTVFDKESTNYKMSAIISEIGKGVNSEILNYDLIEDIKGIKNKVEIEGYKKANIKDSVALVKFFAWLEDELVNKNRKDLNEYQIGIKNKQFREEQDLFMGESFAPICACGANAAIIHYEQNENLHSDMNKDLIFLCDTGGQYKDGTTDITRTVHYGTPTEKEKEMYTRVLLGNLSLERVIFRKGKTLSQLDGIPRSYLFMVGLDYKHSTCHGVGHFLNVHEGPRGRPLSPGNVITNEPGYYEKDNFGIRIENEVLVAEKDENNLYFENITLLPYERNLIDMNLISPDFKNYIDNFHKKVFDTLSPLLKDDEKALDYLKRKTQPL